MKYPLIIIGAGASFDFLKIERYSPSDQNNLRDWRAPITNSLFDVSRFSQIISHYEDVKPLASTIINIVDNSNPFDLEKYLSEQQELFPEKSLPQLIALRFYLAELLSKVSYYFFHPANNHAHLIDQINKRAEKAIVVNFNYDTLFEKNIKTLKSSDQIDSYIEGNIKIIKIHGAHNWRYTPKVDYSQHNVYDFFISGGQSLYEEYKDHQIDNKMVTQYDFRRQDFNVNIYREQAEDHYDGSYWKYYLPAIAIPIATKSNSICPPSHIKTLIDNLSKIDRILVIGWRAQDQYLLQLLKEHVSDNVKMTIVSSNEIKAQEIAFKFKDISQLKSDNITISKSEGYTKFLSNGECEKFFA